MDMTVTGARIQLATTARLLTLDMVGYEALEIERLSISPMSRRTMACLISPRTRTKDSPAVRRTPDAAPGDRLKILSCGPRDGYLLTELAQQLQNGPPSRE